MPMRYFSVQAVRLAAPTTGSALSAECQAHEAGVRGERRSPDPAEKNAGRVTPRVDMRDPPLLT